MYPVENNFKPQKKMLNDKTDLFYRISSGFQKARGDN